MKIVIETIPHDKQLYPTVGDWRTDADGVLQIKVSDMGDKRYELLVAIHELVEQVLCEEHGVTQEIVDEFDIAFEKDRAEGKLKDPNAEPGDSPEAPYGEEHCVATGIERIVAAGLGVCWDEYAEAVEALP